MKKLLYLALVMLVGISIASCDKKKKSGNRDIEFDDTEYTLSLSTTSTEIVVGNSIDINALITPTPKSAVIWSPDYDDTYIDVMVDEDGSCHITGKKVTTGTTFKIGAAIGYQELDPVSCKIAVVNNGIVVKEGSKTIAAGTQYDVMVGKTIQLSAALAQPEAGTTTWTSSNTTVATVSNSGLITAKAAGTATITVKIHTNSGMDYTSTVTVKVNDYLKITCSGSDVTGKTIEYLWGEKFILNSNIDIQSWDYTGKAIEKCSSSATKTATFVMASNVEETSMVTITSKDGQTAKVAVRSKLPEMKISGDAALTYGYNNIYTVDGYTNLAWTISPTNNGITFENGTYTYTGDRASIKATKYTSNTVTLTAKWNGHSCTKTLSVKAPEKFSLYYEDNTFTSYMRTSKTVTSTITLKSLIESNKYDLTQECTWTSSDPKVATVSKGVVTVLSVGSTTISAKLGDAVSRTSLKLDVVYSVKVSTNEDWWIAPSNIYHPYGGTDVVMDYSSPLNVEFKADNEKIGKSATSGNMDLFGWNTPFQTAKTSIEMHQTGNSENYLATKKNYSIGETVNKIGWLQTNVNTQALTKEQWQYLLENRSFPNGYQRYYVGTWTISSSLTGAVLLIVPDGWAKSGTCIVPGSVSAYTNQQLQDLSKAGIIVLPGYGYRDGQTVTEKAEGWYWTDSPSGDKKAWSIKFRADTRALTFQEDWRYWGYRYRTGMRLPYKK